MLPSARMLIAPVPPVVAWMPWPVAVPPPASISPVTWTLMEPLLVFVACTPVSPAVTLSTFTVTRPPLPVASMPLPPVPRTVPE